MALCLFGPAFMPGYQGAETILFLASFTRLAAGLAWAIGAPARADADKARERAW